MRLLLDTHASVWWRNRQRTLAREAVDAIAAAEAVFVSLASAWEAAIKVSLGRMRLTESFRAGIAESGFTPLPIEFVHLERIPSLPHHHRDPFDRLLVAQALVEGLTIVTEDRKIAAYNVAILDAL
jgi:PIN domain nuclease of toxin-antitoxin system